MKVKYLKELLKNQPEDREIFLVGYDCKTGKTIKKLFHLCCNTEHQEKINELWVSDEGLRVG